MLVEVTSRPQWPMYHTGNQWISNLMPMRFSSAEALNENRKNLLSYLN